MAGAVKSNSITNSTVFPHPGQSGRDAHVIGTNITTVNPVDVI